MKTRAILILAASFLLVAASQTGFAQDDTSDESAAEADESAAESDESDESDEGGEDADEDDESDDDEDDEGDDESDESDEGDEEGDESRKGPGGRELRDDYPGTDESKEPRMEGERIEEMEDDDDPDGSYDAHVRELETDVDDLKEKVFSSKSRITLLKEAVLSGTTSGSRAVISHVNDLRGNYAVRRAHFSLDGSRVYDENNTDELASGDDIEVYNGSISPGSHRISVILELQGTGMGLFSYMDDYKFTVRNSCEFKAQEGRSAVIDVRLIDQKGAFAKYEERPGLECSVQMVELSNEELRASEDES
ncbi:MAG: hypothetical protein ACOCV2_05280, partial [Persicimonas sp.]